MCELKDVLRDAHKLFGLGSSDSRRGKSNLLYIENPARLTVDELRLDRDQSVNTVRLQSPVTYLSGIEPPRRKRWFSQEKRQRPSFSIVVGEYGLGKTELLYCVAEALEDEAGCGGRTKCLPIALASARELGALDHVCEPEEFVQSLLAHVFRGRSYGSDTHACSRDIVAGIRSGDIVLILDALDELVSELPEHGRFLESLGRLVEGTADTSPFHIVISMRLEHLQQVGGNLGDVPQNLKRYAGASTPVNFLLLDFFEDSTVDDYIANRLEETLPMSSDNLVEELPKDREFRDMLRRPLMARILCDLIEGLPPEEVVEQIEKLRTVRSPAILIEQFTKRAEADEALHSAQVRIQRRLGGDNEGYSWSHKRLAEATLDIYRRGDWELNRLDVEKILDKDGKVPDPQEIRSLKHAELEMSIYKCPFLSRAFDLGVKPGESDEGDLRIHFTHRVFFEYFTTKGVVAELLENPEQLTAFHDLVLNEDMHKFLRALTIEESSEDLWYKETGRAYGLRKDCRKEWERFGGLSRKRCKDLDKIRRPLLDARSGLRDDPEKLREDIQNFLDEDSDPDAPLAPRYEIPNYEAVAVCLLNRRAGSEELHERFSELLDLRMNDTVARLNEAVTSFNESGGELKDSENPREVYELLVERLLDVGHRCRYSWVNGWTGVAESHEEAAKLGRGVVVIQDRDAARRVKRILDEINKVKA